MNNLLPCIWPACKSEEVEIDISSEIYAHGYAVRCNYCGAIGPWANTKKGAKELWNDRKEA